LCVVVVLVVTVCSATIPDGKGGVNIFFEFFLNGFSTTDGHGWTRIKTPDLQGILTQRRKEAKAQGVEKDVPSVKCHNFIVGRAALLRRRTRGSASLPK
jgi:hypothetical protein